MSGDFFQTSFEVLTSKRSSKLVDQREMCQHLIRMVRWRREARRWRGDSSPTKKDPQRMAAEEQQETSGCRLARVEGPMVRAPLPFQGHRAKSQGELRCGRCCMEEGRVVFEVKGAQDTFRWSKSFFTHTKIHTRGRWVCVACRFDM